MKRNEGCSDDAPIGSAQEFASSSFMNEPSPHAAHVRDLVPM